MFILAFILASVNLKKKITLETNALNQALGSCLSQSNVERQFYLVAYWSRKFLDGKLNYNVHNKKLLATVNAFIK